MSKVFRLYKGGASTYEGWNEGLSFPYSSTSRDTIEDPEGADARNEITSIPSPFARIDLVKTAFKEVCRCASRDIRELEGTTIFHKMVSDSLDVGEIFFNIDKYKEDIDIITWNPTQAISTLKGSNNLGHIYVGDTLEKYLSSDAKTYNFDKLRNIYLLNYKKGPDEQNIIGATSPATLFFSGANNLDYVQDIFFANSDKPFDDNYQPLYKREYDYIKVWWTIRETIPNFASLFPEIEEYLSLTYKAITDLDIKNKLREITSASVSDYSSIDVQNFQQKNQVEILGTAWLKKKTVVAVNNEFTIKADKSLSDVLPLVLPVESGNKYSDLLYVNGKWGTEYKAPYKDDEADITKRTLPYDGTVFAYLTISDFLEDNIVEVKHKLNKDYYFDGRLDNKEDDTFSFLLPIKPLYFKYFSIDTLMANMPDGEPAFQMNIAASKCVEVIIRIPILGNNSIKYIEYQRRYYSDCSADVSKTQNSGGMQNFDFTGMVMPSKKFQNDKDALYTVSCVSGYSKDFSFSFYKADSVIRDVPMDCRNKEKGQYDYKAETYTINKTNFDFIQVSNSNGIRNIIIPLFATHQSLDDFEFAVDLGSSNTHIELKKSDDSSSEPFSYKESDPIYSTFFKCSYTEVNGKLIQRDLKDENELMEADFIPNVVGINSDFQFPTRTALSYAKSIDWKKNLRVFGLLNFCFTYNKRSLLAYNEKPIVNIKWNDEGNAQYYLRQYINNILLLIRNKVIASNGNLANTKITWFYPNSMSPFRLSNLKTAWNESYKELFNNNGNVKNMSESVAPIKYYFKRYATAKNLINVDIGGSTTDIAFSLNGKVNYITSFKFATNSLFEDSFSDISSTNGIIDWFKNDILNLLNEKGDSSNLVKIFKSNEDNPSNMASFLFSLKDNSSTKELSSNKIDFNKVLQTDSKFKIVFILFYTAIIYHIAQIVREKSLEVPRHIAFSGNGSKVVNIISSDVDILAKYTKLIFEKVLGQPYLTSLDILGLEQDSNPKESTCKGGLIPCEDDDNDFDILTLKDSSGRIANDTDTYKAINDSYKESILSSVEDFFSFALKEIPAEFNLKSNFGVDDVTIKIAKDCCKNDIDTYLDKGIKLSSKDSGIDTKIEDALSFYPIKGILQSLSLKIQEYYNKNKKES